MHRLAPCVALALECLVSPSLQTCGYSLEMMLEEHLQRGFEGGNIHAAYIEQQARHTAVAIFHG